MDQKSEEIFKKINAAATDIQTGKSNFVSMSIYRSPGYYTIHTVNLADYNNSWDEDNKALKEKYQSK